MSARAHPGPLRLLACALFGHRFPGDPWAEEPPRVEGVPVALWFRRLDCARCGARVMVPVPKRGATDGPAF